MYMCVCMYVCVVLFVFVAICSLSCQKNFAFPSFLRCKASLSWILWCFFKDKEPP